MPAKINFDIDIDVANRTEILATLKHRVASIQRDDAMETHNTGVYFQDIPTDPFTNSATIDHKEAEKLGYLKIDFLNVYLYEEFESEAEIEEMMKEPDWELLQYEEVVSQLFHIRDYTWLMQTIKPKSIDDLAKCLAIIRPAKRYLANASMEQIDREVWEKPTDGAYHFKRAHAYSYSMAIIVQLNKLVSKLLD